jgi:hypothetical protein
MPNNNQLGGIALAQGDTAHANYSATDIPAGTAVIFDTSNAEALFSTPGVKIPATGATGITGHVGITIDKLPALGKFPGRVRRIGHAVATASGSIAAGAWVTVESATGKEGRVRTKTTGEESLGQAMNAAADGDPVRVAIEIARNA